MNRIIRPELPDTERTLIEVGQVWTVDGEPGVRWFVLTGSRIIALFAGAADHTPQSLVFTYGDRLRLEAVANVYAMAVKANRHEFVISDERDENYIMRCRVCGAEPLAQAHRDLAGRLIP